MAGMELPYWQCYAAETLSDSRFQRWSLEARGAFFTLLNVQWREGAIPGDQKDLADLLHVDSGTMRSLWSAIGDRFIPHPDRPGELANPRMEEARDDALAAKAQKKKAGKAGAESRWRAARAANGTAMALPCDRSSRISSQRNASHRIAAEATPQKPTPPPEAGPAEARWPLVAACLTALWERGRDALWPSGDKAEETCDRLERAIAARGLIADAVDRLDASLQADPAHPWLGWHLPALKAKPKPSAHGDLGAELRPWPQRLEGSDRAAALREWSEVTALDPDFACAPMGVTGTSESPAFDAIRAFNEKWRAIAEARS